MNDEIEEKLDELKGLILASRNATDASYAYANAKPSYAINAYAFDAAVAADAVNDKINSIINLIEENKQ